MARIILLKLNLISDLLLWLYGQDEFLIMCVCAHL